MFIPNKKQYRNIPMPVRNKTNDMNCRYVVKDKEGNDTMRFSIRCCNAQARLITPIGLFHQTQNKQPI